MAGWLRLGLFGGPIKRLREVPRFREAERLRRFRQQGMNRGVTEINRLIDLIVRRDK